MLDKTRITSLLSLVLVTCLLTTAPAADKKKKKKSVGPAKKLAKCPAKFQVKFETSKGTFVVEVVREWSPIGADRFYEAVQKGFYNECRFFRVIPGFVVQFGINGDPKVQKLWREANIKDDKKIVKSNLRGFLTYAKSRAPNSRTTQLFINYRDNAGLDNQGFTPFGKVIKGMDKVVDKINAEYKQDPQQFSIQAEGNKYLKENFPRLDYIKKATVVKKKKPKAKKTKK